MKACSLILFLHAFFAVLATETRAEESHHRGLSVSLGYISSHMSAAVHSRGSAHTSYRSTGATVMVESNQMFFGPHWSLVPLVGEFTAEKFKGGSEEFVSETEHGGHTMLSSEIRIWASRNGGIDDLYMGFQFVWAIVERISKGPKDPTRRQSSTPEDPIDLKSETGNGWGIVGGMELTNGFFVKFQYMEAVFDYDETLAGGGTPVAFNAEVDFQSVRIHTGYRF